MFPQLNIGDAIHVRDIQLPPGVTPKVQLDLTAFSVLAPVVEEEPVAAEAEAAAAGPEVISEKKEEGEAAARCSGCEGKSSEGKRRRSNPFSVFDFRILRLPATCDETAIRLIAGLGNPGPEYAAHAAQHRIYGRRSAGRAVWIGLGKIDKVGRTLGEMWSCASGQADELHESQRCIRFRSRAVLQNRAAAKFWSCSTILLLPLGRLRLRDRRRTGRPQRSRISHRPIWNRRDPTLRIGIGAAPREGSVDYVLGRFFDEEKPIVRSTIDRAVEAVKCAIDNGLVSAMNTFNKIRRNHEESL